MGDSQTENVGKFIYFPKGNIVALLKNQSDVDAIYSILLPAGYINGETIGFLHGEDGLRLLDPKGEHHGLAAKFFRIIQNISDEDAKNLRYMENGLRAGDYAIRVEIDGSAGAKEKIRQLLKQHNASHITYFGEFTTEVLDS